jgi:hypothetical protein
VTDLLPPRAALLTRLQASARQVPIITTMCDYVSMCDGVWAGVPIARLLILAGADIGKKNNVSVTWRVRVIVQHSRAVIRFPRAIISVLFRYCFLL